MNFVIIHAPGARLVDRPVGQYSSALPLNHGCPPPKKNTTTHNVRLIVLGICIKREETAVAQW